MISTKYRDDPHHHGRVIPIATIDRVYVQNEPVIVGIHNLDVHGKRVLLLNADSYSGTTLFRARQLLEYSEPTELKTGSLVTVAPRSQHLDAQPDFCGAMLPVAKTDRRLPWRRGAPRGSTKALPTQTTLVVPTGLVATGKTSVTNSLVKELGFHPVYSDWYWFIYGLQDRASNPATNYRHNEHMIALCWSAAAMGLNAVFDSTSRWRETRDQLQDQGSRYGIRIVFVRCSCSEDAARARIRGRKHIGAHDFGTEFEYDRIRNEFQPMDDEEVRQRNLIDIDSEALTWRVSNVLHTQDLAATEREMSGIGNAISNHYFDEARSEWPKAATGG